MNRMDLQELSKLRSLETAVLIDNKSFDGAYYLCGYSAEFGLKACIAKRTREFDFFDKKTANDSFTHELMKLVRVAELEKDLSCEISNNEEFSLNWNLAKEWTEASRYERCSERKATQLYKAINDKQFGIMSWIKKYW